MRTVLGLYDARRDARETIETLVEAGFSRERISMATPHKKRSDGEADAEGVQPAEHKQAGDAERTRATSETVLDGLGSMLIGLGTISLPTLGVIVAAGPLAGLLIGGTSGEGLTEGLGTLGIPREEAEIYTEAVRRGATLVLFQSDESRVEEARALMGRHNPIDITRRSQSWDEEVKRNSERNDASENDREVRQQREPMTEKREGANEEQNPADRQGARVHTYEVTEPIEERVRLHQEHIDVERVPLDRDSQIENHGFDLDGDEVIEFRETQEEVIVEKRRRVVEQIRIIRDAEAETEIIREVARRYEAEVERTEGEQDVVIDRGSENKDRKADSHASFDEYEEEFRRHYQRNLADQGHDFSYYRPAYIYGCRLAERERDTGNDWEAIEREARRRWLEANPDTSWAEVDSAVYASYERCQSSRG